MKRVHKIRLVHGNMEVVPCVQLPQTLHLPLQRSYKSFGNEQSFFLGGPCFYLLDLFGKVQL